MLYTLKNNKLAVEVSDLGAELRSFKSSDGTEYLWQGDPAFWSGRSPNLFPYIGRMINKQYEYDGKTYTMDIHGFAASSVFEVVEHSDTLLVMRLNSNEETKKRYPWDFRFSIFYKLINQRLDICFKVENLSNSTMLFAVGGHPGFCVPLCDGERFEDYRLRFPAPGRTYRVTFTSDCFVDSDDTEYYLDGNNCIPLRHDLFDEDAIVLRGAGDSVILESVKSNRAVEVRFPQMEYIGFWHMPKMDAPYVCIEPWTSLPSAKGEKTVLESQGDLLRLEAGGEYSNTWSVLAK